MATLNRRLVKRTMTNRDLYDCRPDRHGLNLLQISTTNTLSYRRAFQMAVASLVKGTLDWAEFGVAKGATTELWLQQMPLGWGTRLWGFDTWQGLPEDFNGVAKKGHFSTNGVIPETLLQDDRFEPIQGLFEHTLPTWIEQQSEPLAFVHVDCDLYDSVKTVLAHVAPLITSNTVVLFDELCGHPDYLKNEYKAFTEFLDESGRDFEWLLVSRQFDRVAVRILGER